MTTLFWLLDSQTLGGLVVVAVFVIACVAYLLILRWIRRGAEEEEA